MANSYTRARSDTDWEVADTPLAPISGGQLQGFAGGVLGSQTKAMAGNASGVFGAFEKLDDYKTGKDAESKLDDIRQRAEEEANSGLNDAPGTPKSWYMADGSLDKDKINDFKQRYAEEYASVKPVFWQGEAQMNWEKSKDEYVSNSEARLVGQALRGQAASVRRVSEAALENKLRKNDTAGFADELKKGVAAGVWTPQEAENKLLKQAKKSLLGGGGGGGGTSSINVGGKDYAGNEALLMSCRQKRLGEMKVGDVPVGTSNASSPTALSVSAPDKAKDDDEFLLLTDAQRAAIADEPLIGLDSIGTQRMALGAASPDDPIDGGNLQGWVLSGDELLVNPAYTVGQEWARTGDQGRVIGSLNKVEFNALQSHLIDESDGLRLVNSGFEAFNLDEPHEWRAERTADDFVKRIAAVSSALGQMTPQLSKTYATYIAEQMLDENVDMTAASFRKLFDSSALALVLGEGNEDVGNAALDSVFNAVKTTRDQEQINNVVGLADKLAEVEAKYHAGYKSDGHAQDWKTVQILKPDASTSVELDPDSDDPQKKKDFQAVADLYSRYGEFLQFVVPKDKKDFEKAVKDYGERFLDAFRTNFNTKASKETIENVARDMKGRMVEAVAEAVERNGGRDLDYASLLHVLRDAAKGYRGDALSDQFDETFWSICRDMDQSKRAAKVHKEQASYAWAALAKREALLGELNVVQKNYDEFQKEEERKVAEREKAEKKAADAKLKRDIELARNEAARSLATPQRILCTWDGISDDDRAVNGVYSRYGFATARVPKAIMDRIIAAGWEPDDDVYLHVDGQGKDAILVDMNNLSPSDEILMSSRATASAWGARIGKGRNAKYTNGVFDQKALPVWFTISKYRQR